MPNVGKTDVKNVLRVDVNAADVIFSANGKEVIKLPRAGLNVEDRLIFASARA